VVTPPSFPLPGKHVTMYALSTRSFGGDCVLRKPRPTLWMAVNPFLLRIKLHAQCPRLAR
jgi:hypothetical protein